MKIKEIYISNHGYIYCESSFYKVDDVLQEEPAHCFTRGVNWLCGEIDSGIWAISYLLSMYNYRPKDFILFDELVAVVNGESMSIKELNQYSCYMDKKFPMFSSKKSVRKLVEKGIRSHGLQCSAEDIRELFELDEDRFERPLTQVGNTVFRCMAAIAYSNNKEVYCFPWLSKSRFDGYQMNLTWLLDKLAELNKIVIVPIGKE